MTTQLSNRLVLSILSFAILAGLTWVLLSAKTFSFKPNTIYISVENKQLIKPEEPIVIKKGETVTFKVQIDEAEQFHLKGYHAFLQLIPGVTNSIEIEALTVGSFPIYLDKSRTYLTSVQIVD